MCIQRKISGHSYIFVSKIPPRFSQVFQPSKFVRKISNVEKVCHVLELHFNQFNTTVTTIHQFHCKGCRKAEYMKESDFQTQITNDSGLKAKNNHIFLFSYIFISLIKCIVLHCPILECMGLCVYWTYGNSMISRCIKLCKLSLTVHPS